MSGVIAAVVAVAAEVSAAVTAVAEAVAGAVMAGAEAIGVVGGVAECTAVEASLTGAISGAAEGAIYGAGFGALQTGIMGGDLGENMLFGAISGGLGGAVSGPISSAVGELGLGPQASRAVGMGLGNAFGGTIAASAMGKDPLLPALGGLASGAVDFAVGGLPKNASWLDKGLRMAEVQGLNTAASMGLGELFASSPQQSAQTMGGGYQPTVSSQSTGASPTTGQAQAPGSSALAQVLRTDAGSPIFGSSDKEGGTGKSGWNVESLRYMGSEA